MSIAPQGPAVPAVVRPQGSNSPHGSSRTSITSARDGPDVRLWYVRTGGNDGTELHEAAWAVLSDDERERAHQLRCAGRRHEHVVSRALVRSVVWRLTNVPHAESRFRVSPLGRPEVDGPSQAQGLSFSLSHTRGLIVCVTAWDRRVGVDAERVRLDDAVLDVATRSFDPAEAAAVLALAGAERRLRFLQLWTLKEALGKARGVGLRAHLPEDTIDQSARWQFGLHRITDKHVVATAVEGDSPTTLTVSEATGLIRG